MNTDMTPQIEPNIGQIEPNIGTPWPEKINRLLQAQAAQIADLQAWCSDLTNRCTQMEDKYARLIRETRSRRTD